MQPFRTPIQSPINRKACPASDMLAGRMVLQNQTRVVEVFVQNDVAIVFQALIHVSLLLLGTVGK